jgi:hypothetical protein
MNPRVFATIGLRLIGFWLILESFLYAFSSFYRPFSSFGSLPLGVHRRSYDGGNAISIDLANVSLHDAYYVIYQYAPWLMGSITGFCAGGLLMFLSRPLARIFVRNLDNL